MMAEDLVIRNLSEIIEFEEIDSYEKKTFYA